MKTIYEQAEEFARECAERNRVEVQVTSINLVLNTVTVKGVYPLTGDLYNNTRQCVVHEDD